MEVVQVLQKGQIVIPKRLREEIGIKQGMRLLVERIGDVLVVFPEPEDTLGAMRGLLKGLAGDGALADVRRVRRGSERRLR